MGGVRGRAPDGGDTGATATELDIYIKHYTVREI